MRAASVVRYMNTGEVVTCSVGAAEQSHVSLITALCPPHLEPALLCPFSLFLKPCTPYAMPIIPHFLEAIFARDATAP